MENISVYGVCVSRDIFGMHKDNGGFKVDRYVYNVSPLSTVCEKMVAKDLCREDAILAGISRSDSEIRAIFMDINRSVFDWLNECRSPWLVLDAGMLRFSYLRYISPETKENVYINMAFKKDINKLIDAGFLPAGGEFVYPQDLPDDEYEALMERFSSELLKIYDEEHIILNDLRSVELYVGDQKTGEFEYTDVFKINKNIKRGFEFFKKRFPKAHVIEFPRNVVADKYHKWGWTSMHFTQEYYDYGLKAVKLITGGRYSALQEREELTALKEECSELYLRNYASLLSEYKEKVPFCVLGGCYSRDIFGKHENEGGYIIRRNIFDVSPLAVGSPRAALRRVEFKDEQFNALFGSNPAFRKRSLMLELNGEVPDYLDCSFNGYLMLDASPLRHDHIRCEDENGRISYLTNMANNRSRMDSIPALLPASAQNLSADDIPDDEYDLYMEAFADVVHKIFPDERIILNEGYPVSLIIENDRAGVYNYQFSLRHRKRLERGWAALLKYFPLAHVIEFPEGVMLDPNHKWGRSIYHFVQEYYDYGLEAVNIITKGSLSREEERKRLNNLKYEYEDRLREKKYLYFPRAIREYKEKDSLCSRMVEYERYMRGLLEDEQKLENIVRFFIKNRFSECAIYGASAICNMLIPVLRKWGIKINYVVENMNGKTHMKVPVVSRRLQCFPETQVMIIADVMNTEKIREKLSRGGSSFPVYDVYEIIK